MTAASGAVNRRRPQVHGGRQVALARRARIGAARAPWVRLLLISCLTRDTVVAVSEASIRDLRNHGGEVVDRAAAGERITITRDGKAVAELRPVPRNRVTAAALVERFNHLPAVDPRRFREDVDSVIDQALS